MVNSASSRIRYRSFPWMHHRGMPILQFFLRTLHPHCLVEILRCRDYVLTCSDRDIDTDFFCPGDLTSPLHPGFLLQARVFSPSILFAKRTLFTLDNRLVLVIEGAGKRRIFAIATDRWLLTVIYALMECLFCPTFASCVVNSSLGLNSFWVWKPMVRKPSLVSFVAGHPLGYYGS
ncbi:hypothetical protein TIFTF001_007779 [Ficus carica]|uniref:Uncharacterized protein n=1 Tax=Ficus carica TaxID=3494 RepID=A0AA87ZTR8_FICCA|nr:hypothetical protein TIFTF001_007779 [Ficus carica]